MKLERGQPKLPESVCSFCSFKLYMISQLGMKASYLKQIKTMSKERGYYGVIDRHAKKEYNFGQQFIISTTMEEQKNMAQLFADYPTINQGLKKLNILNPTDFQQQLFEAADNVDHLIITAPQTAGKTVAVLLHALRRFTNEQQGFLVILSHSKELSQSLHHFVSVCSRIQVINLYMQDIGEIGDKAIIVGSPLQVNNLWKKEKDRIAFVVVPEADLLYGFGYGQALELLAGSLNSNKVIYKISCISRGAEIQKFKGQWMPKAVRIDYQLPENEVPQVQKQQQITHFYSVGDKLSLPINLYVTLKFGLVNPKILVLVENLRQVYRYALLLERCRISGVGLYNHQDPINLRFYTLSIWMNGSTNILIATPQLLVDLESAAFKKQARKVYKKPQFQLINMTSIILIGLHFIDNNFDKLLEPFRLKPFLMTFLENNENEITKLQDLISFQKEKFEHSIIKQLPITRKQLEGFRYRINDVWNSLNNHRADLYRQLDFKKKLLKTPELKEQFEHNSGEREALVKAINDLRKKIDHGKTAISEYVPDYLVPECLKASYQEKLKVWQEQQQEKAPMNHQKVQKVLRYVNLDEQNPQTTDISRLKLISARKRWKLLHGFKLKKKNKRLQEKGVFES